MAETIGTLIDQISALELRRWQTEEVMLDAAAPAELRHESALLLRDFDDEHDRLCRNLDALWAAFQGGTRSPSRGSSRAPASSGGKVLEFPRRRA